MRLKRVHPAAKDRTGRHRGRRPRRWLLLPASTVTAALTLAYVAAAHDANGTGGDPSAGHHAPAALGTGVVDSAVQPYVDPDQLAAVTVGPENVAEPVRMVLASARVTTALDQSGIPDVALSAYQRAASVLATSDADCHLPWQLLAAIGRVESDHGRFGGAMLRPDGYGTRPIRGIPLDGRAHVALVRDTDGGRLDGDPNFDRAVGPMQFIPSTWSVYGVDANGDGKRDPDNIFDAALAAAVYLCTGDGDMTDPTDEAAAVRRYNDADEYVRVVLALTESYEHGDAATVSANEPVRPLSHGAPATVLPPSGPLPPPAPSPTRRPAKGHVSTPAHGGRSSTPGVRNEEGTTHPIPTSIAAPTPPATTPTPRSTLVPSPTATATPTAAPTAPASSTPTPPASSTPTGTPTNGPSGDSTPTASASPTPTDTATPPSHTGRTANIGWAPAMREVVVRLLTEPSTAPTTSPATDAH